MSLGKKVLSWDKLGVPVSSQGSPVVPQSRQRTRTNRATSLEWGTPSSQPPAGFSNGENAQKKKVRRIVANGGVYWSDRLTRLALALSRFFFFSFPVSHPLTTISRLCRGGTLPKLGSLSSAAHQELFARSALGDRELRETSGCPLVGHCSAPLPWCAKKAIEEENRAFHGEPCFSG